MGFSYRACARCYAPLRTASLDDKVLCETCRKTHRVVTTRDDDGWTTERVERLATLPSPTDPEES